MTKYFLRLILLVGCLVGIVLLIGTCLPRKYDFQTSIQIDTPADKVFPYIKNLKRWQAWSAQWNPNLIDNLEIQYNADGNAQTWKDSRGKGKLWVTGSEENRSLGYQMVFANFPEMTSQFKLQPGETEGKTIVVWTSKGALPGGPFYGFFGSFFSSQMKHQYDKSLTGLKNLVEARETPMDEKKE